ncbi:preprotein translocase subunit SecG [Candidatus Dojkabacteria bacterium]|uniref:Protein-export membrane protein SecG n=1 Tax=Candidatus Dojkabacteria bacterium TaxID=2099670 RepID=A0A3M0Z0L8_9BACT|nr:MAG: preprotein translocase subunit SecG [Candidatus Dojkabacteria bacterium]
MRNIVKLLIVVVGFALVTSILLQNKSGGLGAVFGGSSGGETYRSKRGLERFLQNSSIILAVIFALLSLAFFVVED